MQTSQHNQNIQEDEIDLKELWNTLVKSKKFIIIFTSIITIIAIIWAMTRTPMYEAKTLVEIGNYKIHNTKNNNNNKLSLDNSAQLAKKLNILFIDMYKNQKNSISKIDSISISKGTKNFIDITSLSISNDLASKEILKVVDYIKSKHQKILDDIKQRRELEIKNIESKISNIQNKEIILFQNKIKLQEKSLKEYKTQLNSINANISKIKKSKPTLAVLELMEKRELTTLISNLSIELMQLKNEKDNLETTAINDLEEQKGLVMSMLLPHNYKNSEIIGKIITNDYPVKPKKKLIVIVAFITGFILSIFLVFFFNFIRDNNQEK